MSIISDVKCARCDRQYTGVRSRCPYCGARRIGKGKYSEDSDNSKGKMLIGILIMGVLVLAVGVLLFTAPRPEDSDEINISISSSDPTGLGIADEGDNVTMDGSRPNISPSPSTTAQISESPSPSPPAKVTSVIITYAGTPTVDFMEPIGQQTPLVAKVEPAGVEFEKVVWESSDTSVFDVVTTNLDGTNATVTIIGSGVNRVAVLTVRVGDVEASCYVRVKAR